MWLFRSCCASNIESDLTLMEMVHVHKRLALIILARHVTWHLNGKTCLVEVVAASVERERVESFAGAVGATMKQGADAS